MIRRLLRWLRSPEVVTGSYLEKNRRMRRLMEEQ